MLGCQLQKLRFIYVYQILYEFFIYSKILIISRIYNNFKRTLIYLKKQTKHVLKI